MSSKRSFFSKELLIYFFLIFLFSISLTRPIEKLLELTLEVARGNFDVDASGKINSKDEVNDLAFAFDRMTSGLKALVKTQGADVAQTLMDTDLENLGGTKKYVVVLFSDLRDFTKFSEGVTPEEVVAMLNEYFEVMVACIERNKGRVNKFIGDAIMAMWGAPHATDNDPWYAVMAAVEMRIELNKLNELRISRGQGPIRIGVGLHCGEAVAGTIGSKSRLEYTIIGDTVNQSSRLESSTKAFGTDLLISEDLMNAVKAKFIIDYAGAAEVKGKTEALKMFKVRGYLDKDNNPILIETPYSEYQAEAVDKIKVA
jgi:adenylate cyclase